MKKFIILILILTQLFFLSACQAKNYRSTLHLVNAFQTNSDVKIYTNHVISNVELDALRQEINEILKGIDKTFDIQGRYPDSALNMISKKAGIEPVLVSADVIYILNMAFQMSELSKINIEDEVITLFDPTISPVWKTWNFVGRQYDYFERIIKLSEIEEIKEEVAEIIDAGLVNYQDIIIDEEASTVYLKKAGMEIDLGSIVKGYAADKVKEYLINKGYDSSVINIGGNVQTIGDFFESPHRIGIRAPYINWTNYRLDEEGNNLNETFGTIEVVDTSVVTSGTYERFIRDENKNEYHHILNPATGMPINNGVISITVLYPESAMADAYSTTLFALGLEKGMEIVRNTEGLDAIWIVRDGKTMEVYISSGIEESFTFNENVIEDGFVFKGVYNENTKN